MSIASDLKSKSAIKGFKADIEKLTTGNPDFRKVLYTGHHLQLVLMSLKPGEEIGEEVHEDTDQFFRIESGKGKCIINGNTKTLQEGDVMIVPAGARHNILNTADEGELKLYTIYAPPHHKDGIVRKTKKEAEMKTEEFDGITTE